MIKFRGKNAILGMMVGGFSSETFSDYRGTGTVSIIHTPTGGLEVTDVEYTINGQRWYPIAQLYNALELYEKAIKFIKD
jgi:hypothetical protein